MAAFTVAAGLTLILAIPALLRNPPEEGLAPSTSLAPPSSVTTVTETTVPAVKPPLNQEIRSDILAMPDGSAVTLVDMNVWRTTDNGETWAEWYAQDHEIDLLAIADDGAVLAVRNSNNTSEALGPGSEVNDSPEVHRFDPATGQWSVIPLPRPELADLAPQEENIEECALFGLQSWVDGISIVGGPTNVILGDHRVVADGVCDEDFQFLWTSLDGLRWQLTPSIGIDGYLAGVVSFGDSFLGYGSERPWLAGNGGPTPRIWKTSDLTTWTGATLDLAGLPDDGFVHVLPAAGFGYSSPRVDFDLDGSPGLTFTFEVMRPLSGLDASSDMADLRAWVIRGGSSEEVTEEELEGQLEMIDVDFPLDEAEIDELQSFLGPLTEPAGTLTLSTTNGADWETTYSPG